MHSRSSANKSSFKVKLRSGEGKDLPKVLFVCVHNAGRSRMAEAFFNQLAGGRYEGISAGTQPASRPHPEVVASMNEVGVAMTDTPGTVLTQEMADSAIKVIGMGCSVEEACPALRTPLEDWALEDPKGKAPSEVAAIRDLIEIKVRNLIAQLERERVVAEGGL